MKTNINEDKTEYTEVGRRDTMKLYPNYILLLLMSTTENSKKQNNSNAYGLYCQRKMK